jgi:hypothetical protein
MLPASLLAEELFFNDYEPRLHHPHLGTHGAAFWRVDAFG